MASMKKSPRRRASAKMSTRRSVSGRAGKRPAVRRAKKPARFERFEVGGMTVREAGRKGGLIGGRKGGLTVKRERGVEFYQEIGRKGGQRVRDLIAAGKRAAERPSRRRHT